LVQFPAEHKLFTHIHRRKGKKRTWIVKALTTSEVETEYAIEVRHAETFTNQWDKQINVHKNN
jgi:hypothetical protein